MSRDPNHDEYRSAEKVLAYLRVGDQFPHRTEGEAALLEDVPKNARRILDLGCGGGRLLEILLAHCPDAKGLGTDFSPPMLEAFKKKFADEPRAECLQYDLAETVPDLGTFDVVASSFAIHHVTHERKRELYAEVFDIVEAGGVFANLEHVSSPTEALHARFFERLGVSLEDEDKSNKLLDVETQLSWLREIGYVDVDCVWKWREMALLVGFKP